MWTLIYEIIFSFRVFFLKLVIAVWEKLLASAFIFSPHEKLNTWIKIIFYMFIFFHILMSTLKYGKKTW